MAEPNAHVALQCATRLCAGQSSRVPVSPEEVVETASIFLSWLNKPVPVELTK